jgi:Bacterial regulatory proteins, tetR family/MMPL family
MTGARFWRREKHFVGSCHLDGLPSYFGPHPPQRPSASQNTGRADLVQPRIVIALLGMFALGVAFLHGVAIAASLAVLLVLAASLTLLPALLIFVGHHVGRGRRRRSAPAPARPATASGHVGSRSCSAGPAGPRSRRQQSCSCWQRRRSAYGSAPGGGLWMTESGAGAAAEHAAGRRLDVRERVLETASQLFYRRGVRAVGVDLVVEEAGVAKTSLYRHFRTKDELIAAFLAREDEDFWATWNRVGGAPAGRRRPRARGTPSTGSASALLSVTSFRLRGAGFWLG